MTFLLTKFLRRVRIRGGEFDASARAMHRKAALENVSRATIERKLMSTKTTLKRISLVAVAAMGFGLLSVVPSSATSQADTLTLSSATSSVTVGSAATTTLTQAFTGLGGDTMTVTASVSSAPTGNSTVPALTVNQASNTNASTAVSGGGLIGTTADTASGSVYNSASGVYTVTLPSSAIAGTYVIKFTAAVVSPNTGTVNAAVTTWTVTVAAEAAPTATDSTWGMIAGAATPTQGTHTAINATASPTNTQVATIVVVPQKPTTTALTNAIKLSASISGPGTLGWGTGTGGASTGRSITAGTAGQYSLAVYSDGTSGVSTITITEPAGAVLATATVNFSGSLASYTLTPTNTITPDNGTDSVTIAGKDAAGTTAPVGTYYLSSSNTAVATVSASGQTGSTFTVTGVGVGTAVITVGNAASSPTITKTYTVTVGKHTIKTLTMTTDAASYAAGGAVTVTVTALGSDGLPVGDGTYNAFAAAVTSNLAVQGTLPTASIAFVGGKKTYTIYAPAQDGTVTLNGTEGSSTDNVIANGSTAAATITVSFDSVNAGSSAAVDAANAATDAANYAADAADAATTAAQEATAAAQAAQDSADAATAAVVALGLRVDTLMASVRAQLTSLSNLLVRIIKKTHA